MMFIQHSVNSNWPFNTQSRVLQADWFILQINEKATLNINMPYWVCNGKITRVQAIKRCFNPPPPVLEIWAVVTFKLIPCCTDFITIDSTTSTVQYMKLIPLIIHISIIMDKFDSYVINFSVWSVLMGGAWPILMFSWQAWINYMGNGRWKWNLVMEEDWAFAKYGSMEIEGKSCSELLTILQYFTGNLWN